MIFILKGFSICDYFWSNELNQLRIYLTKEIYINSDHENVGRGGGGYHPYVINIVLIIIQRDIEWLPLNYEFLH